MDIDFALNMLEASVCTHKAKDTLDLQYQIQNVLMESMKALKDIKEEPEFSFLILETTTNTLWATDKYSMFQVDDNTEIVIGSGEQNFYKLKYKRFIPAFMGAVDANEYCQFPVYTYRDGEMYEFDWLVDAEKFETFLFCLDSKDE